ncbi:hypothetical protein HUJ05_008719 [Dendroctonus ponderosae]|nr:hypothetical protein HUJ05_008719 [Dendroctonus ponderosae]
MHNIAMVFVKMRALEDQDRMRTAFSVLLSVPLDVEEDDKYNLEQASTWETTSSRMIKGFKLSRISIRSVQLIAPLVEDGLKFIHGNDGASPHRDCLFDKFSIVIDIGSILTPPRIVKGVLKYTLKTTKNQSRSHVFRFHFCGEERGRQTGNNTYYTSFCGRLSTVTSLPLKFIAKSFSYNKYEESNSVPSSFAWVIEPTNQRACSSGIHIAINIAPSTMPSKIPPITSKRLCRFIRRRLMQMATVQASSEGWNHIGMGHRPMKMKTRLQTIYKGQAVEIWMQAIAHLIDAAEQNAWQLHRKQGKLDHLAFWRNVALTLIETNKENRELNLCQRLRPSVIENVESRYDRLDHLVEEQDRQTRCQDNGWEVESECGTPDPTYRVLDSMKLLTKNSWKLTYQSVPDVKINKVLTMQKHLSGTVKI